LSCLSPQSLALTAAAALLPACLSGPAAARTAAVDDVGNRVVLETPARRIVSLAPHITETLFAAGAGDRIVATVHHSDYPAAALAIPVIGSYKSISYEALIGLNPDLVIAWASGNGEEIIARIRSLGPAVYLDEPRRIEDIAHSLRRFGRLAGTEATAERKAAAFMAPPTPASSSSAAWPANVPNGWTDGKTGPASPRWTTINSTTSLPTSCSAVRPG